MTDTAPRKCFAIIEGQFNPEYGYIPSLVTENESGHQPLIGRDDEARPWYWGKTLEEARAVCAKANLDDFGLDDAACKAIVESSIAASIREGFAAQSFEKRIERELGRRP